METPPVPVSRSKVIKTEIVLPQHTNSLGTIFGGTIMAWIDIAAAIAAQRHASCAVVTASLDALNFVAPVYSGWVVNLKASVNYAGRTSMEVGVRVDAENPITKETHHTASAYLTFVAINDKNEPQPIPPVLAETAEEKRRYKGGVKRREQRLRNREEIKSQLS